MFKSLRQILSRESFERFSVQQLGPEHGASHVSHIAPTHAGCQGRPNDAADASSRNHRGFNAGFMESFDNADMGETTHSATAEGQANAFGFE